MLIGFGNERILNISVRFDSACVAPDYHLSYTCAKKNTEAKLVEQVLLKHYICLFFFALQNL